MTAVAWCIVERVSRKGSYFSPWNSNMLPGKETPKRLRVTCSLLLIFFFYFFIFFLNFKIFNSYMRSQTWTPLPPPSPQHLSGSGISKLLGEGNGNPLQCSCLENPRDGGAWWTAVYGVAQSQTRLKWLSSSSSSSSKLLLTFIGNCMGPSITKAFLKEKE